MNEAVQVGVFVHVSGKHETAVDSHLNSIRSPSLAKVTRVERSHR